MYSYTWYTIPLRQPPLLLAHKWWCAMLGKLQLKRKEAAQDVPSPGAPAPEEEQAAWLITDVRSGRPLPPSCQDQLASLASLLLGGPTAACQPPRPLPTPSLLAAQQGRAFTDEDSQAFLQLAGLGPIHPASQPAQWLPAMPFPGFCKTASQQQTRGDEGNCLVPQCQLAAYPKAHDIGRQQQHPGDARTLPCAAPAQGQPPGKAAQQQLPMPYQLTSNVQEVQKEAAGSGGASLGSVAAAGRQRQSQLNQGQHQQQQLAHGKITTVPPQQQLKDPQQVQHFASEQPDLLHERAQHGQHKAGEGNAGTARALASRAAVKECPICGQPFASTDSAMAVQSHIEACLNGEAADLCHDDDF